MHRANKSHNNLLSYEKEFPGGSLANDKLLTPEHSAEKISSFRKTQTP